ncbi:MAG: sensor histidine kinase [Lachnospiraceae bacterium]
MKLLRNTEVKRSLMLFGMISVAAAAAAWFMDMKFGIFTLALCVVFILLYLGITHRRYLRIAGLAEDIDRILHGESRISLEKYSEGELEILQSEIYKVMVRLGEQQQKLIKDKVCLADSLADISHQIRTPLTSINLLIGFLSEPDITEARRLKLVGELYDLLSRIDWLITALLKISKLDAGIILFSEEKISLKELAEKACEPLLIPMELREQELKVDAEGDFLGDISWTCEALGNIVKNCMEHTPEKGRIHITASENALYSEICVEDTGSGIPVEDMPHIFERFYKGKDSGDKGFGIGLALARMIIVSQNGTVKAENLSPSGAKFSIRFYKTTV